MVVSFIIVAYNAEKFLDNSLGSLLNQNYDLKKIEVILVDSCSSDNTKNIMEEFKRINSKRFKNILVLDNEGKTLPCGWNVALKNATGEFILRVDAHTMFPENFISENIKEMENGENIVGGRCESITLDNSRKQQLLLAAEESVFGAGVADFRRKNSKEYVSTLAFAMYRKKVFEKVGFYNENLARTEDNEMHYRMKLCGYKFLLSPNIRCYRYARNSLKELIKQKFNNGKWIGITMYYCPKCFSLYHVIPLLFVLAIIGSIILAFFKMPLFIITLALLYTLFNLVNLVSIMKKNKFHIDYLCLPFIILTLHLAYGIGTIFGLMKGPFYKWKRRKLM